MVIKMLENSNNIDPYLVYRQKVLYILVGYDVDPTYLQQTYNSLSDVEKATLLSDIASNVYPINYNQFMIMNYIAPTNMPTVPPLQTPVRQAILEQDWKVQYDYRLAMQQTQNYNPAAAVTPLQPAYTKQYVEAASPTTKEDSNHTKTLSSTFFELYEKALKYNRFARSASGEIVETYYEVNSTNPVLKGLNKVANTSNLIFNSIGAAAKASADIACTSLKNFGASLGSPFTRLRELAADKSRTSNIGRALRVMAGIGAAVCLPLKIAGIGVSMTGTLVKSAGEVVGNTFALAGALTRAIIYPVDFTANLGNVWKQVTMLGASIGHVATDLAKDLGTETKILANQLNLPVASNVLSFAGAISQSAAKLGEGIIQGARKMMVLEARDAGALLFGGLKSAISNIAHEISDITLQIHQYRNRKTSTLDQLSVSQTRDSEVERSTDYAKQYRKEDREYKKEHGVGIKRSREDREKYEENFSKKVKFSELVASSRGGAKGYRSIDQQYSSDEQKHAAKVQKHNSDKTHSHADKASKSSSDTSRGI